MPFGQEIDFGKVFVHEFFGLLSTHVPDSGKEVDILLDCESKREDIVLRAYSYVLLHSLPLLEELDPK